MTEQKAQELSTEWKRLHREMEKAERRGEMLIAASYENSIARIERELEAQDIDPRDYID